MQPLRALLFAILLGGIRPSPAQDSPPGHATASEIHSLAEARLSAGEGVKLRGTVVFASSTGFNLHDGTSGIQVAPGPGLSIPAVGTLLTLEGITAASRPSGKVRAHVIATSIVNEGLSAPPEPIPTALFDLSIYRHWDQFVSVEGIVIDQSWSAGVHRLLIGSPDGSAVIHVLDSTEDTFRPDLLGARIRARGINRGEADSPCALLVAMTQHWQILDLGTDAPFALPLTSVAAIATADPVPGGLVKLWGVVLHHTPQQQLYLRDAEGRAFRAASFPPLPKPAPGSGRASSVGEPPLAKVGDEVEVVGIIAESGSDLGLQHCQIRLLPSPPHPPLPVPATIPQTFAGTFTNQVVTLRGRLVEQQQLKLAGNRYRTVLFLEDDSKLLRCQYDSREIEAFPNLAKDDLVEVTGLVPGSPGSESLYLVIHEKDDVVSHGLSPEIRLRKFWIWGAFTTLGAIILLLWVLSLRRSLQRAERAEKAEREINATLEDRVRDRTAELETAQAELDRALGQERELGALKDRFVAMVSHEFRTPLGVTMSALELLRHHRSRLDQEKQGELLDDIFSATLRMSGLMEQILLLGRAESGRMNLSPKPLDLPGLSRRIGSETLASQNSGHEIDYRFEGELAPVSLDENLMRLMLGNLLSNAVKYSPEGGPVRLSARRNGDRIEIEVRDEGIGIPEQDQSRLFEAFHRATNVGEISGTGLGLLLVKRCAELHQGSITFASTSGKGTTFHLSLPLAIA